MYICRTCLSAEDLRDIFEDSDVKQRKEQLTAVTGVKISPNDGLPQKICSSCSELIDSAVKLRETCAYTEKMLIQNGYVYNEQKLLIKMEKSDVNVKEEYDDDDNDCDLQYNNDKSSAKYEHGILSDCTKHETKCLTKNIDKDTIYIVATVSNDNYESTNILNNIATVIPIDPSVDDGVQKMYNNIESQEEVKAIKKETSASGDLVQTRDIIDSHTELIDTEGNKRKRKTKRMKKEDEERNPPPKKSKRDTEIETLDGKGKLSIVTKDKTIAERNKIYWSLAVEPIQKNERVQCKICHKFTKYTCFTKHAATHFDPEYTCEECGLKLMSKKNLADHHQRKHGATKNFACAECDYRSVLPAELQNHIRRVHTGERPFVCKLCSESFTARRCLTAHMRRHFPEKKYQCDRCSSMFKAQGQLTAHYNHVHIMKYTFYCDHCSYQVAKGSKVKDHLTKVHGIPREKQTPIKFFKERRDESQYGATNTKHLKKPEDVVKKEKSEVKLS